MSIHKTRSTQIMGLFNCVEIEMSKYLKSQSGNRLCGLHFNEI